MKTTSILSKIWRRAWSKLKSLRYYWNRFVLRLKIDAQPAFIVGCGHGGTSILLAILGAHPRLHAIPFESGIAFGDDILHFKDAIKRFNRLALESGKNRWIEKSPKHILHIEKLLTWHPGAKIILIVRDGSDVAASITSRTGSLEAGIKRWHAENLAGKRHWGNDSVHVVRYEDLITDFETTVIAVLTFLDEEYYSKIRNYHKKPKKWYSNVISKPESGIGDLHNQHRNWQVNQPLFDGRGRYKELSP